MESNLEFIKLYESLSKLNESDDENSSFRAYCREHNYGDGIKKINGKIVALSIPGLVNFYKDKNTSAEIKDSMQRYLKKEFKTPIIPESGNEYKSLQYLYNAYIQENYLINAEIGLSINTKATGNNDSKESTAWLVRAGNKSSSPDLIYENSILVDAKIEGNTKNSSSLYTSSSAKEAQLLIIFKINNISDPGETSGDWHIAVNMNKLEKTGEALKTSNGYCDVAIFNNDLSEFTEESKKIINAAITLDSKLEKLSSTLPLCKLS